MKAVVLALLVMFTLTSNAETGRRPNEWVKGPDGKLETSFKEKIANAFLKAANAKNSIYQKDVLEVIKAHQSTFEGCGSVEIPTQLKLADFSVTPFEYSGFFGRHCVPNIKDCDTEDDESFLILVPFTSSCTRTTYGGSLSYSMKFVANTRGGKDRIEGPGKVAITLAP